MFLKETEKKFVKYARSFLSGDKLLDEPYTLKTAHSLRVLDEAKKLSDAEALLLPYKNEILIAALLHDYGRFEQFKRHSTFSDPKSCDHGDLSAELVERDALLNTLNSDTKSDIVWAIKMHNKIALSDAPSPRAELVAKAVRDADKLDIFPVIFSYMRNTPTKMISGGLEPTMELSEKVYQSVVNRRCSDKNDLRTYADFLVNKYAWVFDLYFEHTKKEFAARNYIKKVYDFLPKSEKFDAVYNVAADALAKHSRNPQNTRRYFTS